jgi:glutamine phosphoribosylpyrophosphate amidotransferase
MVAEIAKMIGFTSLKFLKLGDLISAVVEAPGNSKLQKQDLCLYCWTGKY